MGLPEKLCSIEKKKAGQECKTLLMLKMASLRLTSTGICKTHEDFIYLFIFKPSAIGFWNTALPACHSLVRNENLNS